MKQATGAGERGGKQDPSVGLRAVAALRRLLEQPETLQVPNARAPGWSWQAIADSFRVSKQASTRSTRPAGACCGARDVPAVHGTGPRVRGPGPVGGPPPPPRLHRDRAPPPRRAADDGVAARVLRGVGITEAAVERRSGRGRRGRWAPGTPRRCGRLGIDLDQVRRRTEASFGPGALPPAARATGAAARGPAGRRPRPVHPRSKKVLELTSAKPSALKHRYIGTEHLLLGVVREGEGLAMLVLTRLGAGPQVRPGPGAGRPARDRLSPPPRPGHGAVTAGLRLMTGGTRSAPSGVLAVRQSTRGEGGTWASRRASRRSTRRPTAAWSARSSPSSATCRRPRT